MARTGTTTWEKLKLNLDTVWKPGIYSTKITRFISGKFLNGAPKIEVHCEVISGSYEGKILKKSYHVTGPASAHLAELLSYADPELFSECAGELDIGLYVGKLLIWEVLPSKREFRGRMYQNIFPRPRSYEASISETR